MSNNKRGLARKKKKQVKKSAPILISPPQTATKWRIVFVDMDGTELGELLDDANVMRRTFRYFDSQMHFLGLSNIHDDNQIAPYVAIPGQIVDNDGHYQGVVSQVLTIPITLQINGTLGAIEWLRACMFARHENFCHPTRFHDTVLTRVSVCGCEIRATLAFNEPELVDGTEKVMCRTICDDETGTVSIEHCRVPEWCPTDESQRTMLCKILYFKTCNITTKSCTDCTTFSDVLDPLIALGIAMQIDADDETYTLLASAFVWHFAAHCSAQCTEVVDQYIETHPYLRCLLSTVIDDLEHDTFIPILCKHCIRCIVFKNCVSAMRLAEMNIPLDRYISIWPKCDATFLPEDCESIFEKSIGAFEYALLRPIKHACQSALLPTNVLPFHNWDAISGLSILAIIDPNIIVNNNIIDVVLENPLDTDYYTSTLSLREETPVTSSSKTIETSLFEINQLQLKRGGGCRVIELRYADNMGQGVAFHFPTFRCYYRCMTVPSAQIINRKFSRIEVHKPFFRGHGKDCLTMPRLSILRFAYFPAKGMLCASIQALVSVFLTRKILFFGRGEVGIDKNIFKSAQFDLYQKTEDILLQPRGRSLDIEGFCYQSIGFTTKLAECVNRQSFANAIRQVVDTETSFMNSDQRKCNTKI